MCTLPNSSHSNLPASPYTLGRASPVLRGREGVLWLLREWVEMLIVVDHNAKGLMMHEKMKWITTHVTLTQKQWLSKHWLGRKDPLLAQYSCWQSAGIMSEPCWYWWGHCSSLYLIIICNSTACQKLVWFRGCGGCFRHDLSPPLKKSGALLIVRF